MAKMDFGKLDAEDRRDMKKGTYSPAEERKELKSKGKGHTGERPTGPVPKGKTFQKTTGPAMQTQGPRGPRYQQHGSLVNTLAGRRMNGIGKVRNNKEAM